MHDHSQGLPGNLSRHAMRDLVAILRRSVSEWGPAVAARSRVRLIARILSIENGTAIGHARPDVASRTPTLFVVEPFWVIAYGPSTRQVFRIIHGARDFPALFK